MTDPDHHETDEKSGANSKSTASCDTDESVSNSNEPGSNSNESVSNTEDTHIASSVGDDTATQRDVDSNTGSAEQHQHEPTTEETPGDNSTEDSVSWTAKSADNQSTESHEAEASAASDRSDSETTRVVDSPIPAVEIDEPVEHDEYVDCLETKVSSLQETVEEKQATVETLRTVTPKLDGMHTEPIATDRYIETLEGHVEKLNAELDRKKSVIQELKNQKAEFRKAAREETTERILTEFVTNVREPLVRGTEQVDDVPNGMKTTIVQFDNLLQEYDGKIVEPAPGDEVDRDIHQVRGKEPGNFADGTIKSVEERGLRVAGTVVKQPAVLLTDGTPDETHTEPDDTPPSDEAAKNHDDCDQSSSTSPDQDGPTADNGNWIDDFESRR